MKTKKLYLEELLRDYVKQDTCLAFSGGIDSSLLLNLMVQYAKEYGTTVHAVTFDTTLHPGCDVEIAKKVAGEMEAVHHILVINELDNPQIMSNPKNRCYLCKKELFSKLMDYAGEQGIACVVEGTNEDDLHVYRPGLQAIKELGIKSPLAKAGITKEEVRAYAQELGISVAKRPSTPCLATRLPYGTQISLTVLRQIEEGEAFLRNMGYENVRIRLHDKIARLELDAYALERCLKEKDIIIAELKKIGFVYITLDLEGFRSGSMDVEIS